MKLFTPLFEGEGEKGGGGSSIFGAASGDKGGAGDQQQQQQQGSQQQQQQSDKGGFSFAGALGEDGSFKPGWTDTLPEELKHAKDTLGRYKTPVELMRGLDNANKLLGAKASAVVIPGDNAKPEEIAAFRKSLGVPDKIEDYGIKKPDNLPEGVTWDDAKTEGYLKVLHKHNATPALVRELVALQVGDQTGLLKSQTENEQAFIAQGLQTLKKEWGDQFTPNLKRADAVVNHYAEKTGLKLDHPAFAFPEVIKLIASIHNDYMGETKRIEGGGITGNDPATEAKRIQTDDSHPMFKRYQNGEPSAVDHVRGLLKQAADASK